MNERDSAALIAEDHAARARALDVSTSFIVQAPAGSGKTELLIQRTMRLLARVDEPEQVVALTFTRKAAGEMRERVLAALLEAQAGRPVPDAPHLAATRKLADEVLAQDAKRGWAITEHPSRLRMLTFDALATALARRAPLAAQLGPDPGYVDDARALYLRAAEELLESAAEDDAAWRCLLAHLDNHAELGTRLVADMLARRDQWLRQVAGQTNEALREGSERALRAEIVEVLERTRGAFPAGIAADIARFARHASNVLAPNVERRAWGDELERLAASGGLPPATLDAQPLWRTLARFLMLSGGRRFKKSVRESDGFEAIGKGAGAALRRACKEGMESLLRGLDTVPGLAEALDAASRMPDPTIDDPAWQVVEALLDVLRRAAGQLVTVFADAHEVDFVQANLAALDALGDADAPSDVLLKLDASIQHLLVDEFQDTSHLQLRMLARLTAGWTPGDGRTLFAVGDPMQSIYRFREAEVAFFLEARERGRINDVPVESLTLRRNFRSQANVVQWCNDVFAQVLGEVRDPARSVVPFEPAAPTEPPCESVAPALELFESAADEAGAVVRRIRDAQAAGSDDIAVLVRARSHLFEVLPALRREDIPFVAVELDRLSERQAVLDLTSLTHALVQPADRAAWLAVLRAPWCGLTLADLCVVVEVAASDRAASIGALVANGATPPGLSDDGVRRYERLRDVLGPALGSRGAVALVDRVKGAWLALGAPALLDDRFDLDTADRYFDLLATHARGGDVADWDAFAAALDALYATPALPPRGSVQVMTMHKAKGLEFDTVIVAGLAAPGHSDDALLMRWRRREAGLLVAPSKARGGETDPLYRYLRGLEADEEDAELGRLLYVACTRAKTRLHLLGAPGTREDASTRALEWKDPPAGSSLAKLALAVDPALPLLPRAANDARVAVVDAPPLRRVPLDATIAEPEDALDVDASAASREIVAPPFDWARETTRCIGTIAHRLLARIAERGLDAWSEQTLDALRPRVRADLASAGFLEGELESASARVLDAVRRTLADPRGRWLFDASHADARSEWGLSGTDAGRVVHVVLDRTFVAEGERWIVDFKTGVHEGGDVDAFLASEVERYREQLARYGRLMAALEGRTVRLALYYPLVEGGFREIGGVPPAGRAPVPGEQLALFGS